MRPSSWHVGSLSPAAAGYADLRFSSASRVSSGRKSLVPECSRRGGGRFSSDSRVSGGRRSLVPECSRRGGGRFSSDSRVSRAGSTLAVSLPLDRVSGRSLFVGELSGSKLHTQGRSIFVEKDDSRNESGASEGQQIWYYGSPHVLSKEVYLDKHT